MIPFNLNLDFKNLSSLINGPLGWGALALACSGVLVLLGMSMASQDKKEVCSDEFTIISTQANSIETLEQELAQCIARGEISCIQREQNLCRIEKEKIKANCNALLDRIIKDCKK